MDKIIIVTQGGVVTDVLSFVPIKYVIFDFDEPNQNEDLFFQDSNLLTDTIEEEWENLKME